MAIAALSARSSTRNRAGRRHLPSGTWPAAPLAALPALARGYDPRGSAPAIGCADAAQFAARMVNDVPHRPTAVAFSVSPTAIHETYRHLPEARLAGPGADLDN